jgi:tRNA threonylcarbamoyladenosine modification (KEOPS) complex  Pcc1 subunit
MEVDFPAEASAKAAIVGLSHEKDIGQRSKTTFRQAGPKVEIIIESVDVIALRACLNACLRALSVFEQIEKKEE